MRMYRLKEKTGDKLIYEYLCEDYTLPYTGLIEIDTKTFETKLIKPADGELSEERARVYAMEYLPKENFPRTLTHTAV